MNETPRNPTDIHIDTKTLTLLTDRDPSFLKALFLEINPYLVRVCIANGHFDQDAEELIHDTWERFFSNIEKFEGRSQIRTFICGILFNKIREFRRDQARMIYEDDSEKVMNHAFTVDGWWNVPPQCPQKLAEHKQSAELIMECLGALTEQQKAVFFLKVVEGEDSETICNALGVSLSNLRVLLFRAKDKLRLCLEGKINVENDF